MELPEDDDPFLLRLAIMQIAASTTKSINTNPAIAITIAKLR